MRRVRCSLEEIELENDEGMLIDSVSVACGRCGYETESFGRGDASIKRCLVLLREGCMLGLRNYYVLEGDEEDEDLD
jgi:hypothetical protein